MHRPSSYSGQNRQTIISESTHQNQVAFKGYGSKGNNFIAYAQISYLYPGMEVKLNPNKLKFSDMQRVANRLYTDLPKYQQIYSQFTHTITNNFSHNIDTEKRILHEAIKSVEKLNPRIKSVEDVHDALKKVSAAAHALVFLYEAEREISMQKYIILENKNKKLEADFQKFKESLGIGKIDASNRIEDTLLSQEEVQTLRNQVLQMVENKKPLDGIPLYQGKRSGHGDALSFFTTYYKLYITTGQEVIFAPELKAVDERLLLSLRNECRNGIPMPLGDRSKRTDAINSGRFVDDPQSQIKSIVACAMRRRRQQIGDISISI